MEKVPESPTNDDVHQSQSRQQAVFIQSPATTPVHGPKGNTLRITQAQKQALIDNLQLEGLYMDQLRTDYLRLIV
jgi:hypothetical protein